MSALTLCYHAVAGEWDDPLAVRPEAFVRQIRFLARGRRPGTASDAVAGRRVLHVTFDDAYASVADALPALEHARLSATVFACSGYGDGRPLEIPELGGARFHAGAMRTLDWEGLRALAERGVEIGSHTVRHAHLTRLGDGELDRELRSSRERIEDELGRPCRFLAYPYGEHDERVRAAVGRAGYEAAFRLLPGRAGDPFAVPRVGIYRRDSVRRTAVKAAMRRLGSDP